MTDVSTRDPDPPVAPRQGLEDLAPVAGRGHAASLLLLLLLVGAVFLAATAVPYRVDSDAGFQLRSLQQWLRGDSPSPGTLRLPDPHDLSRDTLVWSTWWPPGFPFLYAPLAAAGLSLAGALRLTSMLLFLAGAAGWLLWAGGLGMSRPVRLLYAVSVATYAVTIGGAATLRTADNLTFAAAPWLALLALRQAVPGTSRRALLLTGAALGASYFLKYTLFLAALALTAWLALQLLRRGRGNGSARLSRVAVLGLGLTLPVASLIALDTWETGRMAESATGARSLWKAEDLRSARPLPLALGLVGAPGLGLFQSDQWITHLCYFSDRRLPVLRALDDYQRYLLQSLIGGAGTLVIVWALRRRRAGSGTDTGTRRRSLAVTSTLAFLAALGLVSLAIEYNYAREARYGVGVVPLLHPFVLAGLWAAAGGGHRRVRVAAAAALAVFFAAPALFVAGHFVRGEVRQRLAIPYTPSATGLYVPELGTRGIPEVRAAIGSVLLSPRDVVVLAGPAGTGESLMMWLETPWRTFPMTTFSLPLGGRLARAADLRETLPLRTSRPLRVVLVASLSLREQGWLARIERRVPQARAWTPAPVPDGSGVGIWFADLEAPP